MFLKLILLILTFYLRIFRDINEIKVIFSLMAGRWTTPMIQILGRLWGGVKCIKPPPFEDDGVIGRLDSPK